MVGVNVPIPVPLAYHTFGGWKKSVFGDLTLLQRAELAATGGEARRLIKGGGARLNDEKINDETQAITASDANADGLIKLSSGKKKHALIKLV